VAVSRDLKPWHLYLGVGLALIPIYFAFASGGSAQSAVLLAINAAAPLAVLYGIRLHRPALRLPWYLFSFAFACSVAVCRSRAGRATARRFRPGSHYRRSQ